MSDYEHYQGELVLLLRNRDETLEDQCKKLCNNEPLKSYNKNYIEQLLDDNYKEYYIRNDLLYKINKQEIDPYDDVYFAVKNDDDSFSFTVKYYNGGCCLPEALDAALDKISE